MTNRSLSNKDIERVLIGTDTKIISYDRLRDYSTIEDLFGDYENIVILYETKDHYGHWTALLKYPNHFLVFDSYGVQIDEELDWIPTSFRNKRGIDFTYLAYLLYTAPENYKIEYNEYPLQEMDSSVTTCGYWVIARILMKDLSTDEFAKIFAPFNNLTSDEIVVAYVNQYL